MDSSKPAFVLAVLLATGATAFGGVLMAYLCAILFGGMQDAAVEIFFTVLFGTLQWGALAFVPIGLILVVIGLPIHLVLKHGHRATVRNYALAGLGVGLIIGGSLKARELAAGPVEYNFVGAAGLVVLFGAPLGGWVFGLAATRQRPPQRKAKLKPEAAADTFS